MVDNEVKAIAYFELYTSLYYDNANYKHCVIVSDMAQFIANTSENLGLQTISLNGISESNMSALPDYITKAMDKLAKRVRFL